MKRNLLFLLFLSNVFLLTNAVAQCSENIKKAQDAFDEGHLYGIPILLKNCVNQGSKQDKIEAYTLLTLTYLYIDDPIGAQKSFMELLKLEPEYKVDSTSKIELVHLSKEFITTPIVSWRVRGGVNVTNISTIYKNGTNNSNLNSGVYSYVPGYSIIGSMDIHINKILSFSLESDLHSNSFKYSTTYFNKEGVQNAKDIVELTEKSYNLSLPVSMRLMYPGSKYYPYIYGGYSPNYNFVTKADAKDTNRENNSLIITEDKNLNLTPIRKPFSHSIILGAGLMRRINYHYVFIDVRYKIGLKDRLLRNNQNNFEKYGDINKYTNLYKQQDNDFRQNEFSITAGFVWPKYKPRERKTITPMSFIKGLFKKGEKNE